MVAPATLKLSVIISTWNSIRYVKDCIESIFSLNLPDTEIVMVDSGSTDGTTEYLKSLGDKVRLLWSDKKLDWSEANQIGLDVSSGEWICLSNPDILFNREFLLLLDYCRINGIDAIAPQLIYPDGTNQGPQYLMTPREIMARTHTAEFLNRQFRGKPPEHAISYDGDSPFKVDHPVGSLFLVHRRVLAQMGGRLWHPGYKIGVADSDTFMGFHRNNVRMDLFPACRMIHFEGHRTREDPSWIEYDTSYGIVLYFRYWKMWPRAMTIILGLEGISAFLIDLLVKMAGGKVSLRKRAWKINERFKGLTAGWRYEIAT